MNLTKKNSTGHQKKIVSNKIRAICLVSSEETLLSEHVACMPSITLCSPGSLLAGTLHSQFLVSLALVPAAGYINKSGHAGANIAR
jgi:hypothetical protein